MGLKRKTADLKKRMREAIKGGGSQAIKKQKAIGKKTARERILSILDAKSFHEYDLFVEHAGSRRVLRKPTRSTICQEKPRNLSPNSLGCDGGQGV